ncbi:hypothetical protein A33I_07500 [Alkalihalophilus marmarensis DSM 21297]|uniref:Uncharacterized protein n=1 Tax=Alkalihalophilus marmarensis DSM 21297 TaxID=1188261 RepID=U6SRB4_9BACI|nr:hypothetical protein A33I_07500 [Alkalihalophilus marmarensis DSM 21297]
MTISPFHLYIHPTPESQIKSFAKLYEKTPASLDKLYKCSENDCGVEFLSFTIRRKGGLDEAHDG